MAVLDGNGRRSSSNQGNRKKGKKTEELHFELDFVFLKFEGRIKYSRESGWRM